MARYMEDAGIHQPFDVVSMVMEDYIYHHRFSRSDWEGEPVYQCTDGHGKARYLKWNYASGILHLEAWLKSPFGNEMNLSVPGAGRSGKEYKESIDRLIQNLRSHSGNIHTGSIGQDPLHHQQASAAFSQQTGNQPAAYPRQQPTAQHTAYPQQPAGGMPPTANPSSVPVVVRPSCEYGASINSTAGMILSIFGLLFAFAIPILGIIFSVIALKKCHAGSVPKDSVKTVKNLSVAGIIISIVVTICSYILFEWIYGIMLL